MWYIYTMDYYSAIKKNTFESVLVRWMTLEPVIQSEVSQKEKNKYRILTHTLAGQDWRLQRMDLWAQKWGREGRMEKVASTYMHYLV